LTDPKPKKTFNEDDNEWIGEEKSRSCIPRMSKNRKTKKLVIKEGKIEQYRYIKKTM
jgi:hypothetical protein